MSYPNPLLDIQNLSTFFHTEENIVIYVSLYANNEAMERATATRAQALDSIQGLVSVDTKIGTVEINHTN